VSVRIPGRPRRLALRAAALLLAGGAALWVPVRPSNARDWTPDNARLARATVRGDSLFVSNVRHARYASEADFTVAWEERAYDLRELESAWFVVEPFEERWEGPAHTLVSFGFRGGEYLAVSVEIRKEEGERYSMLKGVMKRFELVYVVADERDVVKLRSNHRRDDVYVYPVRAPREKVRAMLVDMMARVEELAEEPEFYNTFTNNCTSNLVRHVNRVTPRRVPPFSPRVLLPGYSDRLAYELGMIDTSLPFEDARERFRINDRALRWADAPDFSRRIREAE
jgi:Domain of unknown function (DUF4105)